MATTETTVKTKIEDVQSATKAASTVSVSEYGNKSLNLIKLQSILSKEFVPDFLPLSNEQIQNIFKALDIDLDAAWTRFVKAQVSGDKNSSEKILTSGAKGELSSIRTKLTKVSQSEPFISALKKIHYGSENLVHWLEKHFKNKNSLMVRSTGNEDSQAIANPGGNESIASVMPEISAVATAIGQVLASYVSEKSIEQRLHAGDKITVLPIFAVLLQKMIGEAVLDLTDAKSKQSPLILSQEQNKQSKDVKFCSGVVYTRETEGRTPGLLVIQSTYGHGEGVVQSLVPADTFYIDKGLFIDSTIVNKTQRIAPVKASGQMTKLDKVDNIKGSAMDPEASSLTTTEQKTLYELCLQVSKDKQFQNLSLDIEWVLANGQFYIVQVRPTPEPTMISNPSYIQSFDVQKVVAKTELIVSVGNKVLSIGKPEEMIVRKTIKDAWDYFLNLKNPEIIKFILIEENANTTSHYAGFFRSISLPVAKLTSIKEFEERIKNTSKLVFDIQNGVILQGTIKNFQIVSGWCRHPITMPISLYPIPRIRDLIQSNQKLILPRESAYAVTKTVLAPITNTALPQLVDKKTHRDIVAKASLNHQPSLKYLLQQLVNNHDPKNLHQILVFLTKKIYILQKKLHSKILKAELAIVYENLIAACQALRKLISTQNVTEASREPSMEKLYAIHRLEQNIYQTAKTDMVNILSIKTILSELNDDQMYSDIIKSSIEKLLSWYPVDPKTKEENYKITEENHELVLQLLKFGKLIFSAEKRAEWELFVITVALNKEPKYLQQLAKLLKFLHGHHIAQEWLNKVFICFFQDCKTKKVNRQNIFKIVNKFLSSYVKYFKNLTVFNQSIQYENTIKTWTLRLELWGNPIDFEKLYKEFKKDFVGPFFVLLNILKNKNVSALEKTVLLKLLNRAIEVYDLSLKATSSSAIYMATPIVRAKNFRALLTDYLELSNSLCLLIPELLGLKVEQQLMFFSSTTIWDMKKYCKQIQTYLTGTDELLASDTKLYAEKLMQGSSQFYVNAACIGSRQDYERAFHTNNTGYTLTYEDIFTLAHQNSIVASSVFYARYGVSEQDLPYNLALFAKAIRETQTSTTTVAYSVLEYQTQLIGIQLTYPSIEVKYNIPMRQHSGTVKIDYNQRTGQLLITVAFYMMGEGIRKINFIELSRLYSAIHGLELVKHPALPKFEGAGFFSEQSFTWKISVNDISKVELVKACIKNLVSSTIGSYDIPTFPKDKFISCPVNFFEDGLSGINEFFDHHMAHKKEKELCEMLYSFYMRIAKSYESEDAYDNRMINDPHKNKFFEKSFKFVCEYAVSGKREVQQLCIKIIEDIFLDKLHAVNFFVAKPGFMKMLLISAGTGVYYKKILEFWVDFFKSPNILKPKRNLLLAKAFFKLLPRDLFFQYFKIIFEINPIIFFGVIDSLSKELKKENIVLFENVISRITLQVFQEHYSNILSVDLQSSFVLFYKDLALLLSQIEAIQCIDNILQFLNYCKRFDLMADILETMTTNKQIELAKKYIALFKENDKFCLAYEFDEDAGTVVNSDVSTRSCAIRLEQIFVKTLKSMEEQTGDNKNIIEFQTLTQVTNAAGSATGAAVASSPSITPMLTHSQGLAAGKQSALPDLSLNSDATSKPNSASGSFNPDS